MLTVYAICAVVGGLLIMMSLLGGDHGTDHAEISFDSDADISADAGHDSDVSHEGPWLPFLSLRFWSYGLAGFGFCGLILSLQKVLPAGLIPIIAGVFGLALGTAFAYAIRHLMGKTINSGVGVDDMLGVQAEVTVPIRAIDAGKVRATIKGDILDLLAISHDSTPLPVGSEVVIVAVEGDRVRVMGVSALMEETVPVVNQ